MNFGLTFAIIVSKISILLCRATHRGGTTLPGSIARFLYPNVLRALSVNFKIIMVTGTNGKTTTARIIGQILTENGIGYVSNKSGANMSGGIITALVKASDIFGRCTYSTALLEVDEAAFKILAGNMEVAALVVTNFFRDQLDRYGELYSTLNSVRAGIAKLAKTKLVLNADDSLCASLARDSGKTVLYYGFTNTFAGSGETANSDAMFCIYCKTKYEYVNHVYGHLGDFRCPGCGYSRPETQVTCAGVRKLTATFSDIDLTVGDQAYQARINLPGLYNIYNSLAAVACGRAMGLPDVNSIAALRVFECGFGRMETIETGGKTINVILVKNPTGFNQVLSYLLTEDSNMRAAFIINDNYADGTDISWLWDVDFEKLSAIGNILDMAYASGVRAEDMAVRLKYAGVPTEKISVIKDYSELIETGLAETAAGGRFYILPTYTAMLDVRNVLKGKFGLKEFWK